MTTVSGPGGGKAFGEGVDGGGIRSSSGPLTELLNTEEDYIKATGLLTPANITKVMNEYNKNARKYAGKNYATASELKSFLENIAAFSEAHKSVLASFKAGNYNEGIEKVRQLQSAYVEITIQSDALLTKIPPEVNNILKKEPGFNSRTLDSIVSLPYQRAARYPMILSAIQAYNFKPPLEDSVKTGIADALDNATRVAAQINAEKAKIEDTQRKPYMQELAEKHLNKFSTSPESSFLRSLIHQIKNSTPDRSIASMIEEAKNDYMRSAPGATNAKAIALGDYYTKTTRKIADGELKSAAKAEAPLITPSTRPTIILPSFNYAREKAKHARENSNTTTEVTKKVNPIKPKGRS